MIPNQNESPNVEKKKFNFYQIKKSCEKIFPFFFILVKFCKRKKLVITSIY